MKKTIAIIGADGKMGSALARSLSRGKFRVLLFAEDFEEVKRVAEEIRSENPEADIDCLMCAVDASWEADIIIPAVPYSSEAEVARKIKKVATQKIVISIANPFNEKFDGLLTPPDTSAAEELQKILPDSRIIKAFNTTFAPDFIQPVINGNKADIFIAGNDDDDLESVAELVEVAGFNAVFAGNLTVSRTLEQMQLLLARLSMKMNFNWQAGWKILHN